MIEYSPLIAALTLLCVNSLRAGFFHDGGPMHTGLERVLMCYVCYRPDVGYVQVSPQ